MSAVFDFHPGFTPMTRRIHRTSVHLDASDVKEVPSDDLKAILRGADHLIFQGGRTLLAHILKGARRKRLLELKLDQSPVFGYFRNLSEPEILARIDWVILKGYLRIEYDGLLPLLVYTSAGWDIEKHTYAEELVRTMEQAAKNDPATFDVTTLKDKNREVIWLVLDKLESNGNPTLIPLLQAWADIDYKKVVQRIRRVITQLEN